MQGIYIMNNEPFNRVYPSQIREDIEELVDIQTSPQTKDSIAENPSILENIDVIFSGWGGPQLNDTFLNNTPNLKAFFYAAGSMKDIVTEACWQRNITLASAYAANAIPVAEFTLSQILFSLKQGWHYASAIQQAEAFRSKNSEQISGAFASTVGIISLGMVGRHVCEMLQNFDIHVLAYDPFVSKKTADELNVELCSLDEIFQKADVVSLHTPWLKETEKMITGELFNSMKPNSTFINTARGAVVHEKEMIDSLKERPDIMALLDVTYPEPPVSGSLLYSLPNVILTPHIAGSEGKECGRMSAYMLEELKRYLNNQPLKWQITKENFAKLA